LTENTGDQKVAGEETAEVSEEEVASVTDVLFSVVKTSKSNKMYLPNNPLRQRFLEELKVKLVNHLEEYGEIKLDVDQFELKYKGKGVYGNRESNEGLATRMYFDGIKALIFTEGIEEKEITELLEIIGTKPALDADEDIVTLLWIKELPHITCILAEDYLEFDAGGIGSFHTVPQQEKIKSLYRSVAPAPESVPTPALLPQQIIFLTEDDITGLKKAKEVEETNSALAEVIQVLFAIQSVEKDVTVFGDFVEITVKLIGNLIHSGDINDALALVTMLKELPKSENFSPDHEKKFAKELEGTISADIIKNLEGIIDTTDKIKEKDLRDILLLFGKSNIKPICELLGTVQKFEMRKVLIDTLVELGKDSPEVFYPYLTAEKWQLVRDLIIVLRRISAPASLEPVGKLMSHKEPKVRKEVLLSLEVFSDLDAAKGYLLNFLQDEIGALRIHALRILSCSGDKGALEPIIAIVSSKKFDEKDIAEKKSFFEALGALGADEVVPLFKEVLLRKYWFDKEKEKDSVTLAVSGLRKVRTDAALKVLKEVSSKKSNEMKAIIDRAVRGIEMASERI